MGIENLKIIYKLNGKVCGGEGVLKKWNIINIISLSRSCSLCVYLYKTNKKKKLFTNHKWLIKRSVFSSRAVNHTHKNKMGRELEKICLTTSYFHYLHSYCFSILIFYIRSKPRERIREVAGWQQSWF